MSVDTRHTIMQAHLPKELALYVWARRLRLLHRFNRACLHEELTCLSVLRDLYAPAARLHVCHVAWALAKRFRGACGLQDRVLAYLDVAHVAPVAHTPGFVSSVQEYMSSRVARRDAFVSPTLPHMASGPSAEPPSSDTPHLKRPRVETPTNGMGPLSEPSSSSLPPLELQPQSPNPRLLRRATPPPPASPGGQGVERETSHWPMFFVRPPYGHITHLFARMLSPSLLNDEELNRYFGRYGQVSSRRVRSVVAHGGGVDGRPSTLADGATPGSQAAHHMSVDRSVSKRGPTNAAAMMLQDFIIEIDLPQNALSALTELRHAAILFIAPHDSARNVYCAQDLDDAMDAAIDGWTILSSDDADTFVQDDDDDFIPELIVENVPFWYTPAQLAVNCAMYGDVRATRFSIDDRSGAFTGVALLQMRTSTATKKAAAGLHGKELEPDTEPLICGVLDASLNIVSLLDPLVVLKKRGATGPCTLPMLRSTDLVEGEPRDGRRVGEWLNPRVWL